jgi:excisionase family DNA binding protein
MSPADSDILTVEELRGYLKIPKPTIYVLAQSGRIPAAKVGKHWRFRRAEIDEWLKAQQWNRPLQRRRRRKAADANQ